MICNHCFSQIPDGESVCPFCKKRVAQKRFQINIPEEKLNEEFPVRRDEAAHAAENNAFKGQRTDHSADTGSRCFIELSV